MYCMPRDLASPRRSAACHVIRPPIKDLLRVPRSGGPSEIYCMPHDQAAPQRSTACHVIRPRLGDVMHAITCHVVRPPLRDLQHATWSGRPSEIYSMSHDQAAPRRSTEYPRIRPLRPPGTACPVIRPRLGDLLHTTWSGRAS